MRDAWVEKGGVSIAAEHVVAKAAATTPQTG